MCDLILGSLGRSHVGVNTWVTRCITDVLLNIWVTAHDLIPMSLDMSQICVT